MRGLADYPSRWPGQALRGIGWGRVARKRRRLRRLAGAILLVLVAFLALAAAGCRCPAPVTPAVVPVAPPPAACLDVPPPRRPVLKFVECAGWGACLSPEDLAALDAWVRRLNGWAGEAWARCGSSSPLPRPASR